MLGQSVPFSRLDPFKNARQLQDDMSRLIRSALAGRSAMEFPPVNVWTNAEGAILMAEIPGVDPKDLDIEVTGNNVVIRGSKAEPQARENEQYHRQERGFGNFVRAVALPFRLDAEKVQADYKWGVLKLTLPRLAEDKPRQIAVKAGA